MLLLVDAISSFRPAVARNHFTFSTDHSCPLIIACVPFLVRLLFFLQQPKNCGIVPFLSPQLRSLAHSDEALSKEVGRRRCHKGKLLPPLGRENLPSCSPLLGSLPGTLTRSGWVSCLCSLSALRGNMQRMGVLEPHTPSLDPRANIYSNVTLGKSLSLSVYFLKQRGK